MKSWRAEPIWIRMLSLLSSSSEPSPSLSITSLVWSTTNEVVAKFKSSKEVREEWFTGLPWWMQFLSCRLRSPFCNWGLFGWWDRLAREVEAETDDVRERTSTLGQEERASSLKLMPELWSESHWMTLMKGRACFVDSDCFVAGDGVHLGRRILKLNWSYSPINRKY